MLEKILELQQEIQNLKSEVSTLIRQINFQELSYEDLFKAFKKLYPYFTRTEFCVPSALDEILESIPSFTWYDTFYLDRYRTLSYGCFVDIVDNWDIKYATDKEKLTALQDWAEVDDIEEARLKFLREIMLCCLEAESTGFEYDW